MLSAKISELYKLLIIQAFQNFERFFVFTENRNDCSSKGYTFGVLKQKTIMGKFIITQRKNSDYQFNLKAGNGQIILTSQGYATKSGCKNGIDSVKTNSPFDNRYDRKESSNSQYYFNLKAGNGEIIGTSEMYTTTNARDNGIESVKINAPTAEIVDETL